MKTTLEIPDALFKKLKELAAARGTSLKALVESALRQMLGKETRGRQRYRLRKHTFRGKGLQHGLQEGRWADVRGLIYEGQGG